MAVVVTVPVSRRFSPSAHAAARGVIYEPRRPPDLERVVVVVVVGHRAEPVATIVNRVAPGRTLAVFAAPDDWGSYGYRIVNLPIISERIEIDKEATPALLMFMLFNGTLGRAFIEGWYER